MPKDITREPTNLGTIAFQWVIEEYEKYPRTKRWYIISLVIGVTLIGFALLNNNILFALIIVLFGIVIYLHEVQTPLEVNFAITDAGIVLGRKLYRYSELNRFWIIYNPGDVTNLYFSVNSTFKNNLVIPLLDNDPRPIRQYLGQYILEDLNQEEEPLTYKWARILRLH